MLHIGKIIFQIILFSLLSILSSAISNFLQIPIPGAIIGIGILYILLAGGYVKLSWFQSGSDFLIDNLLLFFIPSAIGIITYSEFFGSLGLFMLTIVIISILAVLFSIIACTVWASKLKRRGYHLW